MNKHKNYILLQIIYKKLILFINKWNKLTMKLLNLMKLTWNMN